MALALDMPPTTPPSLGHTSVQVTDLIQSEGLQGGIRDVFTWDLHRNGLQIAGNTRYRMIQKVVLLFLQPTAASGSKEMKVASWYTRSHPPHGQSIVGWDKCGMEIQNWHHFHDHTIPHS